MGNTAFNISFKISFSIFEFFEKIDILHQIL